MSINRLRGFTLVETILAIVVIGVGLAGVLSAFNTAVRSSADPMLRKQMLSLAEEMLEEVMLKPWAAGSGTISGCNRSNADDLLDYNGYDQGVCNVDGTALPGLAGYRVVVGVAAAADAIGGSPNGARRITVTVSRGSESLALSGWRTNYGAP